MTASSLFCAAYPQRNHFVARAIAAVSVGIAGMYAVSWVATAGSFDMGSQGFWPRMLSFAAVLLLCVPLVLLCFDVSGWSALASCVAVYVTQNMADSIGSFISLIAESLGAEDLFDASLLQELQRYFIPLLVFVIVYLVYGRKLRRSGLFEVKDKRMVIMLAAAALVAIAFDIINKNLDMMGSVPLQYRLVLRVVHLGTCLLVLLCQHELLYSKQLLRDSAAIEQMMHDQARQYAISQETIEAINTCCHDLRHRIADLESTGINDQRLADIKDEISVYDSVAKTGNEALDVIVTERNLRCQREGIKLSYIVDGDCVDFIAPADLYSFFGNALDNAIEASCGVEDHERRAISLVVKQQDQMVSIHMENYFEGKLHFSGGLPRSSQGGFHGYGTKSMRLVAERYGGTLSLKAIDGVYHLNALLPVPEGQVAA